MNEKVIAEGMGIACEGPDDPKADAILAEMLTRDEKRPRNVSRWTKTVCRIFGHQPFDASSDWIPFGYSSTGLDDGKVTQHEGARQRSAWVYCARCGKVLQSGIQFEGFVIPARSSVP